MADINFSPLVLHRRKRPSLRSLNANLANLQGSEVIRRLPKTTDLEFQEFSFRNAQGGFDGIVKEWIPLLYTHLTEHYKYPVLAMDVIPPFLVIHCEDWKPLPSERPFMIAGLISVWCIEGKDKWPRVSYQL